MTAIKNYSLVALAVVAILALGLSACDDDDDGGGATSEELAVIKEDLSRTSVTAAMVTYRAEGIHELDGEATTASEIGAGWSGSVERMHAVTVGTVWPDELQEMADELASELALAEEAISADDLKGAKEHIALAHAAWHDLEHDAYTYIGGEGHADGETEGGDDHGDAEGSSPSATEDAGGSSDDHAEESPGASPDS